MPRKLSMKTISLHTWLRTLLFLGLSLITAGLALADGLSEILTRKAVRVGVCEFAPWTFKNKAGQLEGFEIDLSRQIAGDLGVEVEFKVYSLEGLFDALDKNEIDFASAGLAITPARALRSEFSTPYFESGATLVTNRKLVPEARRPEDLNRKGITVVTVADSFSSGLADQLFDEAEIHIVPDAQAAEKELLEGRAQAYLTSLPDAHILTRRNAGTLAQPLSQPLVKSVAGFAVRRGNQALLNFLNAWVVSRYADNLIPGLNKYWFSDYEWTRRLPAQEAKP